MVIVNHDWGNTEYDEGMCLEIIDMYSQGKTKAQFCAKYNLSSNTFDKWRKRSKLFDKACEIAHEQARAYYDSIRDGHIVEHHEGSRVNTALFNRMYNTRFNMPDKRKVKVTGLDRAKTQTDMVTSIFRAINKGDITPDEAQRLASLIDINLKAKKIDELEEKIKQIEQAQKIGITEDGFVEVPD